MSWRHRLAGWVMKATGITFDQFFDTYSVGRRSSSDILVGAESSQASSAVFACVQVRSQDLAKLPLILYRRREDGSGRDRAVDHPLYRVLGAQPNEYQNSFEFREMLQPHLDLRGNCYAIIARNGRNRVTSLTPLHSDWVTPLYAADGTRYYDVRMWGTQKAERFETSHILHIKERSDDGIVGKSCISRARDVIGLNLAQNQHAAKTFANGARLSGVVSLKGAVGKDGRAIVRDEFDESFVGTGANRYGGVAVLAEDAEFTPLSMTSADLAFVEQQRLTRTELASLFRVPPHKIGILDNATFSNIEHQSLEYVTDTLMPIARRWEMALNTQLLTPSEQQEYYFEFLFDALLRGDFKTRMDGYAVGRQWGWFSVNDICDRENWNHVPGGDERLVPLNMWPVGEPRPEKAPPTQPIKDAQVISLVGLN